MTTPDAKSIFGEALRLRVPAERQAYLDEVCTGNQALRQEVESLLSAFEQAGDFFSQKRQLEPSDFLGERPGTMIGRYKLLEKIGEGGFGVVYMAEQEEPVRRRVALKIIKVGMDTREVVARFEAERQALAMMNHPNIARVFDGGATESGRPYFVMELVRGVPITNYCDTNQLPTPDRLRLFIQVCDAVQHAHQKGIIHRDLKPSNILVAVIDDRPVPKVIDFGVAKATEARLTDKTLFTHFHQLLGTPAYMSPEQAGLGLDIDTRCDIYSLGVLLYELLAGVTPFDTQTLAKAAIDEARRIIREVDPPAPSTRLKTLGQRLTDVAHSRQTEPTVLPELLRGDLDCIVMSCLDKDRTRRYQTAASLAQDVQRHLNREPVEARPASQLYRFQKFVQRNKLAVTSAGMITAALVLGLALSTWLFLKEREARHRAVAAEKAQSELRQKAEAGELSARALQYWNKGNLAEAEAANPQEVDFVRGFGGSLFYLSEARLAAGKRDEARQTLESALKLYQEAAAQFPTMPDLRQEQALMHRKLAELSESEGESEAAETQFQNATRVYAVLRQEFPTNFWYAHEEAYTAWMIGGVLHRAGLWQAAEAAFRQAAALHEKGAALFPDVPAFKERLDAIRRDIDTVVEEQRQSAPTPGPTLPIPPRPANATDNMVDLSKQYNVALNEALHAGGQGYDLAPLPSGIQVFRSVSFDVRGIVHLNGAGLSGRKVNYPQRVQGIKIGRKCARLHFLHSTGWAEREGTVVGSYVLHYTDGSSHPLTIVYGRDVRDWWLGTDKTVEPKNAQIAWEGRTSSGSAVRIYKRTWENPDPSREVASLDFVSTMSNCAPFLLAITIE